MAKRPVITFDLDDGAYAKRAKVDTPKRKVVDDDDLLADYEEVNASSSTSNQVFMPPFYPGTCKERLFADNIENF
jgi:hypothetical protein